MKLNVSKCSVVHFGSNNQNNNYIIYVTQLAVSECERDLGVWIDKSLNFSNHVSRVRQKSYCIINCLFRILKIRNRNTLVRVFLNNLSDRLSIMDLRCIHLRELLILIELSKFSVILRENFTSLIRIDRIMQID